METKDIKGLLLGIFGIWQTPAMVTIQDPFLGALFWLLQIAVVVLVILMMVLAGSHRYVEEPSGYPTFWFESGNFYAVQNTTPAYCNNASYDYYANVDPSKYWNNINIDCIAPHYGSVTRKDVKSGFVTTFLKREHTKTVPCSSATSACSFVSSSPGTRMNSRTVGAACTCSKQQDYFTKGIEKMELYLEHTFVTSSEFYKDPETEQIVQGSSSSKASEATYTNKVIKSCVKKDGIDGCYKTFSPGQPIYFTIEEWLELSGISLDDRLTARVALDAKSGKLPQYRSTGLKLKVILSYEGHIADDEYLCTISIKPEEGWNSIGSQITNLHFDSESSTEYNDDYHHGLSFEFYAVGKVTKFDWIYFVNTVVSGLVLLSVCDQIVKFVAFKLHPNRDVYVAAQNQKVNMPDALAKFGISTALACQAFKTWDKHALEGQAPSLSAEELTEVFKGPFDEETSKLIAGTLLNQVEGDTLTCEELVDIMSDGLVSIGRMRKEAAKGVASGKVVPVPE
eukprot:TRINITY_DN33018_c0_g1_i1.p1 TRINITY_DN33018_c0_g1~~TRINITY_DN33018_c0_g1_i1.p1  ORF type:complete len:532 (-),score=84.99 TRINITY_DN33018_c0_g1_i1:105-1634(-)